MRVITLLVGTLLLLARPANCQVLSWQGVGAVRLGMTIEEAERALLTSLKPRDIPFTDECWITQRADGKDEAISYEVQNGKIVVITVMPDLKSHGTTKITDTRGLGVGATEAD